MGGGHTRIQVHKRHATRRALEKSCENLAAVVVESVAFSVGRCLSLVSQC